jgi:hypothetical protein
MGPSKPGPPACGSHFLVQGPDPGLYGPAQFPPLGRSALPEPAHEILHLPDSRREARNGTVQALGPTRQSGHGLLKLLRRDLTVHASAVREILYRRGRGIRLVLFEYRATGHVGPVLPFPGSFFLPIPLNVLRRDRFFPGRFGPRRGVFPAPGHVFSHRAFADGVTLRLSGTAGLLRCG